MEHNTVGSLPYIAESVATSIASRRDVLPGTMRELCDYIVKDTTCSWTVSYKKSVVSDLNRLMELDPVLATLRPNGRVINPRFRANNLSSTNLSKSRINNLRSSCRAALGYAGKRWIGMRDKASLTPRWQEMWKEISGQTFKVVHLSRFVHWCSAERIEPNAVCDHVVEKFLIFMNQITEESIFRVRSTAARWNECALEIPNWPKTILALPSRRRVPLSATKAQMGVLLREDFEKYVAFIRAGATPDDDDPFFFRDDLDDRNLSAIDASAKLSTSTGRKSLNRSAYAEATVFNRSSVLRRLIGICHRATGISLAEMRLSDLVTARNASLILKLYQTELGNSIGTSLVSGAHALAVLARNFIKVEPQAQLALDRYAANISRKMAQIEIARGGGMTRRNRERLEQFGAEELSRLFRLPNDLIDPVLVRVRNRTANISDFVDAQVAVAVAILLHAPIRAKNTISIELGKHLTFSEKDDTSRLQFSAIETKNGVKLDFTLPRDGSVILLSYCEEVLPFFARGFESGVLFPGLINKKKHQALLGLQIMARVKEKVGVTINQHLFRHLMALLYLRRFPGQYEVVQILLGHKSVETTRKFYCGLESEAALQHFNQAMLSIKEEAKLAAGNTRPQGRLRKKKLR